MVRGPLVASGQIRLTSRSLAFEVHPGLETRIWGRRTFELPLASIREVGLGRWTRRLRIETEERRVRLEGPLSNQIYLWLRSIGVPDRRHPGRSLNHRVDPGVVVPGAPLTGRLAHPGHVAVGPIGVVAAVGGFFGSALAPGPQFVAIPDILEVRVESHGLDRKLLVSRPGKTIGWLTEHADSLMARLVGHLSEYVDAQLPAGSASLAPGPTRQLVEARGLVLESGERLLGAGAALQRMPDRHVIRGHLVVTAMRVLFLPLAPEDEPTSLVCEDL
ncbi:MAG: hypothetical protein QGG40_11715, partial [Myxococcota bacterium]|nr:hypothetical protein [Myxococcota bacterium]